MKLLFTFFNPSGGMETLNRIRGQALTEAGHEVHLLYTSGGEGRKNITDLPVHILSDPAASGQHVLAGGYDAIVVCTDIWTMEHIREAGYRGRIVFEVQGLGRIEEARAVMAEFSGHIRRHADGLLFPRTDHLVALMKQHLPDVPQFCFDNPLDTSGFGYVAYPPKPYPIVGWIGRITANKNWREFIAIGERLLAANPSIYLWMFGDATLFEPLEQEAFELWLASSPYAERLIRHSNVPHGQMADYLSLIGDSGGLLCSTSHLEGFGYAVAEAMLCRCPVLSSDSDGIRRFVQPEATGMLYPVGQVDIAVRRALELMNDRQRRERIRERGQAHIRATFSKEAYAKRFGGMLKKVMAAPPRR